MDSYANVPQDILTAFQAAKSCLEKLEDFSYDFLMDAEIEVADIDDSTCHHLCLDIKLACVGLEKIKLDLTEIAKNYNKSFVTDYPRYFPMYVEQYQTLMTQDTLQMLNEVKKMAVVTAEGEMPDVLPPTLAKLCQEVGSMDELTHSILDLCQRTMAREAQLKLRPKKCLKLLLQVIEEATKNQQGVIQMCLLTDGGNLMMKPLPDGKPTMSQMMKRYGSLEEFATAQLHQFSMSDVNTYVVEKALTESRLQGLSEEEMEWWREEPEMARQVRYVIEHLDELGVESKMGAKMSAKALSILMKWAHLSNATTQVSVPRFFRYIKSVYQGKLELPSESNYHKYKNEYSPQENQQMLQKIEHLLQNRKQKAMQVALQAEM